MNAVPFTDADIEYVTSKFVLLDELCAARGRDPGEVRTHVSERRLPGPAYVLPGGREMVPEDFFALSDDAGGPEHLREDFVRRFKEAAAGSGLPDDAEEEWDGYLTGEYAVCLREVSPEAIMSKAVLMERITRLIDDSSEESPAWMSDLRLAVEALDRLERPFAPHYDVLRFGGPSSRDRLITAVRARYPRAFAVDHVAPQTH